MTSSARMSYLAVWLACGTLALLSDVLFYGHPWGINAAIFCAAVVIAVLLRSPGLWRSWMGRSWVLLAGVALLALVEEPSPLAVLMAALAVGTLTLAAARDLGDRLSHWLLQWPHLLGTLYLRLVIDNAIIARWMCRHPRAARRLLRVAAALGWWVVPLLAGGMFLALFAIANPIIARWAHATFDALWTLFDWLPFVLRPGRVALWGLVALGAYGLLRYRRFRYLNLIVPRVAAPTFPAIRWWNGQDMIIRCLLVFNAVFAIQTSLDAFYLYGGAALPAGMTYAHYAHRGAYPLIATALLAGLFVLIAFRRYGAGERSPLARRLVYLWILQNLFLLVSTIWRIWLYVDVYSLTRLRLSAMIWVLLVALGFCWIITKIIRRRDNTWLWRMNTLTLIAMLFVCSFINFDALIATFNVRHCREVDGQGVPIDLVYLQDLGPDALPALAWLRERPNVDRTGIDKVAASLTRDLTDTLADWRGWTFRRSRQVHDLPRPRGPELANR